MRNLRTRIAAALLSVTAATVLLQTAPVETTLVPAAAAAARPCLPQKVPATISEQPVVLVHGWNGSPGSWQATIAALSADPYRAGSRFRLLTFDYSTYAAEWPSRPEISQCLAQYLVDVAHRWQRTTPGGKVLAVGHSMGGIALRFASALHATDGTKVAEVLAGVVTLGTPHTGSPWGGTGVAALMQEKQTFALTRTEAVPPAGSNAQICLASQDRRDPACGQPPLFPASTIVTELGTQITIARSLFGHTLATLPVYGDGIVPLDSSTGYAASGPTGAGGSRARVPVGTDLTARTFSCSYDVTTLPGALLETFLQLGSAPVPALLDWHAVDALQDGRTGLGVAELTVGVLRKPCFHSNLTHETSVLAAAWRTLTDYDAALRMMTAQWYGHGRSITVTSPHTATLQTRTYDASCGDGMCMEQATLTLRRSGATLVGKVTATRIVNYDTSGPQPTSEAGPDPIPVGTTATISVDWKHEVLHVKLSDTQGGTYDTGFCTDRTDQITEIENCGA